MRLLKTGAFVRAAQAARLSIPGCSRAPTSSPVVVASRWASSQAQAQAATEEQSFPQQSVNLVNEVDPAKTGAASSQSGDHVEFERKLQELGQENKIVHDNGQSGAKILGSPYIFDQTSNLSSSILDLVGRNLYDHPDHPICITRKLIESCFEESTFKHFAMGNPVVTVRDNFDILGFPADHPGRSRTDTYYVNSSQLLRTHTSAHQNAAFKWLAKNPSSKGYTICADVYRRDSIDRSHFPVFHQMEGARVWEAQQNRAAQIERDCEEMPKTGLVVEDQATDFTGTANPLQPEHDPAEVQQVARHLKLSLEYLVSRILEASRQSLPSAARTDAPMQARWIEAYFPFTSPSFELEVLWHGGEWLELLGSGVVKQSILSRAGLNDHISWAWGLGIERFAMLLFGIPDIRLFWSTDPRFLKQFTRGKITKFEPFSKYPACYKDIAFWIKPTPAASSPLVSQLAHATSGVAAAAGGDATKASPTETQPAAFHENDIMEVVRDVAGSLVEDVKLVDEFVHPTTGRKSLCYRINYRSLERTLTNEEVNGLHEEVGRRMKDLLGVELR
ncbi:phenylalanine-tRNA ligase [Fonsecaea pedrosoi CBS 271.37]|uniref:Phenylalanine--tRNA ligase, mitochondrial n=1 Tax=Fonsecaea pedrosoi CBS 271.37 TaxID=1442368 RepID=A0A0D2GFG8_9EURO|nr:phenylalanine-tRNA ligase [Fonsecaea pedrosoi CBS 271.37]KIW77375.1 phenylalanine-tRNA ligase [Fonsecaea pedrosoi CBS 271.37]